jgi:hypothetical protein
MEAVMSKYAPLGEFLRKQRATLVPMTFSQIEKIVGTPLPKSKQYPAWWSNNPWNNVMTQIWLDAGFETEQVDVESRRLVFRRVRKDDEKSDAPGSSGPAHPPRGHPLVGWMRGTVTVAPNVDLTEPADPEWGQMAWGGGK